MREWLKQMATKAAHEMAAETKQMLAHGAHELGSAIFNESAFVMYPRGARDDKQIENADRTPTPEVGREL